MGTNSRGQAGTESLTVLAAALILMIVAGVLLFQSGLVDIAKDARIVRSENYWASARPFAVTASRIYPDGMVLELRNAELVSLIVTGLRIDGKAVDFSSTNAPIEPYATDRCTEGSCELQMRPGLVQILSMANAEGFGNPCLSADGIFEEKKVYELDVEITYSGGRQSGIAQKGNVKLAGTCATSGAVPACPYAPLLCCGSGSYDGTNQICCNDAASSYVCNKPLECGRGSCTDSPGSPTCGGTPKTACCGTINYYLNESICCTGGTKPELRPAGTHCSSTCPIYLCNGKGYDPNSEVCCSDTGEPYTCDKELQCKHGGCGTQCTWAGCESAVCGTQEYNPEIEGCCGGATRYTLGQSICCSDAAEPYLRQAGQECDSWCSQFRCSGLDYDPGTHQCCKDAEPDYLCLNRQECGDGICLDYVCGETIYDPEGEGCCGTNVYALGTRQCCDDAVPNYLCGNTEACFKGVCGQYCGTGIGYDSSTSICCTDMGG